MAKYDSYHDFLRQVPLFADLDDRLSDLCEAFLKVWADAESPLRQSVLPGVPAEDRMLLQAGAVVPRQPADDAVHLVFCAVLTLRFLHV